MKVFSSKDKHMVNTVGLAVEIFIGFVLDVDA